ncbi:anoctamin-4-like [Anoplophora glabripennis]|uniref:anoctamin-4-like n=1 Tax=Anoplophora glabripennis TaxID=217634 RepID=UPI000874DD78|nr:anoctamin-4-like [Anoplophora glabripennis]
MAVHAVDSPTCCTIQDVVLTISAARQGPNLLIQYGFVVFFVAGFPLAPFLALANNLVELRVDAYKITNHFKRPVPNKVAGIGAWMGILQAITYAGAMTNAVIIAFTGDFVPQEIYKHTIDYNLRGFVNTTISAFVRSDIDSTSESGAICYYPGKRYPPDHPNKYELTTDYWYMLAMKFLAIVLFEHVVMVTNGIIAYAIPDVPAHVTERLAMEETKKKETRMAALDKKYDPTQRRISVTDDIITFNSRDRILIINQLLERASFGTEPGETGLSKLLKQRVIEDAYPLHDGSAYYGSDSVRQNDRRLLYLHWARFRCWYKEVPLDLVYKYFGCEIAFYFAWVEFFNLMLLYASILGSLVFIIDLIIYYASSNIVKIYEYRDELRKRNLKTKSSGLEPFLPKYVTWPRMIATISVCVFMMYDDLSIWLTTFEIPRTKRDFDNSVLYKRYFLLFVNNYTALFYIAFLQLAFLILLKKLAGNILTLIKLNIMTRSRGYKGKKEMDIPIYERDYALLPTDRYLLTTEFCEMIIEFGFVTFFVAAFPLAPLCALLNNLLEHRLDANKLVTKYRRPIPRKMGGIGAWNGVLLGVTYLSTVTNAFVIAFTSDFVWREVYKRRYNFYLRGFVNSSLSAFATQDYELFKDIPPKPEVCYYYGKRHPPDHPQKYEYTTDHWVDIFYRLICVFVFEHVILVLTGILSYAIPDIPKTVKEHMHLERQLVKEAKLKTISDTIHMEERKRGTTDTTDWIML